MNMSEEVMTTLVNGGIQEIIMILAMYSAFEIMLHIEKGKKKAFFIIFFLDMFIINLAEIYLKYYGQNVIQSTFVVMVLAMVNSIIYIAALKVLTECDYLHIFLTDMIAAIIGTVITFNAYGGMAQLIGEKQNTLISFDITYKKVLALVGALVIMTGLIMLERVLLKKYLSNFFKKQIKRKGLCWGIVVLFSGSGYFITATQKGDILFVITNIVMICISVLILYEVSWWVRQQKEKQIKKENQILSIENAVMKEYYDTLEYQLERTRKFRHDIEKHMTVLKEMTASRENGKALMNYAAQIEEQYNYLQTIDYCGNPVVNAILVNKKHQCQEQNIEIETEIGQFNPGEIKEIDLIAIISNLLDSAMQECIQNIEEKNKKIVFKCGNQASNLFLEVSNTTSKDNNTDRKAWKKDTYVHDGGLSIVREIVEKYDGLFQIEIKNGTREVTVVLVTI